MPGIAERGALAGLLPVEDDYPQALACQLQGAGDADDAGAHDRNVRTLVRTV